MLRHFIDTQDFSRQELIDLMELTRLLKEADRDRAVPALLEGCSLAMIFEEPSTRTRVSFEVAMTKLGGHALYLKPGEIHLGVRESLADTARVLSRMCDVIEARTLEHATVIDLAAHADVPVINGLTDYNHPTQALCDVVTMNEHLPPGKQLEDLVVVFVGDATNVCSSTMLITTRLGMNFVHAAPAAYQAPEAWQRDARANCAESGGSLTVTEDVEAAIAGADVVYTDLWWWVGQEDEIPDRRAAFMPRFQVNETLMALAPPHAVFMHCLPASRGVEVTDEVIDGPHSIVFDQAENRLHAEKAILAWTTWPTLGPPASRDVLARHRTQIEAALAITAGVAGATV